jgi:ABC-type Na+ efflux pump permease subunit
MHETYTPNQIIIFPLVLAALIALTIAAVYYGVSAYFPTPRL